jgi:arylsulfatase A-like enzyme
LGRGEDVSRRSFDGKAKASARVGCWDEVAFGLPLNERRETSSPRRNVLFIPVDDLNDWLGVLKGHPQAKTPNFDRLAGRGTLFTRAYCTAPACNPSRKSVLTGTRPSTSGLYYSNKRIRDLLPDVVTLPEHFKHNGYRVEGGGKIFHSGMNDRLSWHAYFDQPRDPEPRKKPHVGLGLHQFWRWQPLEHFDDDDMADGKLVNWAAKFLKRDHDRPFFLGVGFYRPHMPWHVPKKYFDLFPLEDVQLPTTKAKDVDDLPGYGRWLARERTGFHVAAVRQNQWKPAVQAYLACIAFADAQLGRLLDALDASPDADNTIIVLWSDNGMHLGQKEHWTKWGLWEQATRVPLIIVAPGVTKAGARCDTPVSLLDLYPTLVELCDLPAVDRLEGESLVPLLKDPRAIRNAPAITTHGHMNHAIRTGRWRYIRYRDGSEELYDHRTDSLEWKNVAGEAEFQEELRGLRKWLPVVNVPDPPYHDRKQYWPDDPSSDDVSDYPGKRPEPADATQE